MAKGALSPAYIWACEVWDSILAGTNLQTYTMPINVLRAAWDTCDGSASSWKGVRGAISAAGMALKRVGWQAADAFRWRTHTGQEVLLTTTALLC